MMKTLSVQKLDKLKYLNSFNITYRTKSGASRDWELVSRDGIERLEAEIFHHKSFSDGAMIAATNISKDCIVLVREYRVSAGKYIYSLPAGLSDEGESIEMAAVREFKEETGMDFEPIYTSKERYASVGITNEKVNIVYGYYSGEPSGDYLSDNEDIDVIFVDKSKATQLLESEEVPIRTALVLENLFQLNPFLKP